MYQKISILIIEDERSICDFISKTLNSHEYKVTTANNGKDGLALITSALPDLVLLDLGLPDVDGLDIIKKTRESLQPADHRDFGQNAGERKSFSSGRRC